MKDQNNLDLTGFVAIIRRRIWLVLAIALGTAVLALTFSLLQDDRYEATADLQFSQDERPPAVNPNEPLPDPSVSPERIAATNLALAELAKVGARVKQRLHSPLSIKELRDKVSLKPQGQADIVRITAEGPTANSAAHLANVFAQEIANIRREDSQVQVQRVIDAIDAQLAGVPAGSATETDLRRRQEQLRVEKRLRTGDVEIVQPAIPPQDKSAPKPLRNTAIGLILGLLLGIVVALLRQRFDRRVEDEEQLAEIVGAPVIARVPVERSSGWERELFIESFQFLRANLQLRAPDGALRTIAVTSPLPGNGKSTIAARLADAIALSGSDVIVVDADLRRPALHQYYGVDTREGLTSALVGLRNPVEMLRQTGTPGVRLLAAGPLMPLPPSVLGGSRGMKQVLERLSAETDHVIVDTSPVTIGADTSAIAACVDATVLVVDINTVARDVLEAATKQLHGARANIVGIVVNRAEAMLKDQAYKGYYGTSGRSLFNEESGFAPTEEEPPVGSYDGASEEPDEITRRREETRRASGSQL